MSRLRSLTSLVMGVLVLLCGPAQGQIQDLKTWNEQLHSIEEQLRQHQWESARQAAQSLTDLLVERGGGTMGDHRDSVDPLSSAMAAADPLVETLTLGRAAALRAIAEAAQGRRELARWHWYLAQNLSRETRSMDLTPYDNTRDFLLQHLLLGVDQQHEGILDVLDPLRPERKSQGEFREPVRTRVVYPRLPKDLRNRDRFSHVVFVQLTVDSAGQIVQPLVMDAGFYPGLVFRAFEAMKDWRYQPATLDGKPIPYRYIVPVVFSDDRPEQTLGAVPREEAGAFFKSFTIPPAKPASNRFAGLTVDLKNGALYVADKVNSLIFKLEPGGTAKTFAGTGSPGFNGDARNALESQLNHPSALSLDPRTGELFLADTENYRIRTISPKDFQLRTVAGNGLRDVLPRDIPNEFHSPETLRIGQFGGDGGPAADAQLNLPSGVCADPVGILFIADSGNHRVRAVNRGNSPVIVMGVKIEPGTIQTIAGTGTMGFSGDEGKATLAQLAFPTELRVDAAGNLLIVDTFNQRIRRIDRQSGTIRTIVDGGLSEISPNRSLESWSTSVVGVAVTQDQQIIYTNRLSQSLHRISRDGEDHLVYIAKPRDAEFANAETGRDGEIYLTDVHGNRVLRFDGKTVHTYLKDAGRPAPRAAGVNASSER